MLRYSKAKCKSDILFENQRGDRLIILLLREKKKNLDMTIVIGNVMYLTCVCLGLVIKN